MSITKKNANEDKRTRQEMFNGGRQSKLEEATTD